MHLYAPHPWFNACTLPAPLAPHTQAIHSISLLIIYTAEFNHDLHIVAFMFPLRELCVSCVRVCRAWCDVVYTDPRWRVLRNTDLSIISDTQFHSLTRRPLPVIQSLILHEVALSKSGMKGGEGEQIGECFINGILVFSDLLSKCTDLTSLYPAYLNNSLFI